MFFQLFNKQRLLKHFLNNKKMPVFGQEFLWPFVGQEFLWPFFGQEFLWPFFGQEFLWPTCDRWLIPWVLTQSPGVFILYFAKQIPGKKSAIFFIGRCSSLTGLARQASLQIPRTAKILSADRISLLEIIWQIPRTAKILSADRISSTAGNNLTDRFHALLTIVSTDKISSTAGNNLTYRFHALQKLFLADRMSSTATNYLTERFYALS